MKIVFIIEYFPPFAQGGSEWSTFYLAKSIARKGHDITVLTPNYGAREIEHSDSVKIIRFPFYLKLSGKKLPGNFALTNPLWFLWSAFNITFFLMKEKPDVIHIHGKYSIPSAVFANIFIKKPLIATIRDYMIVCNYGMCLINGEKACNIIEYFLSDFKKYLGIYTGKNSKEILMNLVYAIWGLYSRTYLKYFTNRVDYLTCLSKKQKKILSKNGIKPKIRVIYTNYIFNQHSRIGKNNTNIIFIGRLTYGKGIHVLLKAIPIVKKKFPEATFTIIGEGKYMPEVINMKNNNNFIRYIPHVMHQEVNKWLRKSTVCIVPSIWQDPLPRVAMESISAGTPVIATKSGGLPEIIKDGIYGFLSNGNSGDLAKNIIRGIQEEKKLRVNIKRDYQMLAKKFDPDVTTSYVDLYKLLLYDKQILSN